MEERKERELVAISTIASGQLVKRHLTLNLILAQTCRAHPCTFQSLIFRSYSRSLALHSLSLSYVATIDCYRTDRRSVNFIYARLFGEHRTG